MEGYAYGQPGYPSSSGASGYSGGYEAGAQALYGALAQAARAPEPPRPPPPPKPEPVQKYCQFPTPGAIHAHQRRSGMHSDFVFWVVVCSSHCIQKI